MKTWVTLLILGSLFRFASAQENNEVNNTFQGTRLVNEQSANLTDKGKLVLFIQHRFGKIDGGLYQLFGLDQATMRLGFELWVWTQPEPGIRAQYIYENV